MAADPEIIIQGIVTIALTAIVASMLIQIIDTITEPWYKTKKQRKLEKERLDNERRGWRKAGMGLVKEKMNETCKDCKIVFYSHVGLVNHFCHAGFSDFKIKK